VRYQSREDISLDIAASSLRALVHEQRNIHPDFRPYFVQ
jgi:hypothetical protein